MASALSIALHKLHEMLIQLEDVEGQLAHGPRRIASGERKVKAAEAAIEQQKQVIKSNRKAADDANLKVRTREADLRKLEGVLNQASSNKEYDIVKGQMETAKTDIANLEDAALAAMEASDLSQQELKQQETELAKLKQQLESVKAEVADAEAGLMEQINGLKAKVAEAEKSVKWGEHSSAYGRLRGAHGASALASVEDMCCTACNNRITAQDAVRINTDVMMACRECGRLIYIVE